MQHLAPASTCPAPRSRPIWAEIDLAAYAHNLRVLRQLCGVPLLCVLKADAYGHGADLLSRVVERPGRGATMIGVASVDEGAALRTLGVHRPILLLSAILAEEAGAAVDFGLTPTVFSPDVAIALHNEGAWRGRDVPIHVKIDTGMHRLGVPWQEAPEFFRRLRVLDRLRVAGIYTHFACADSDPRFTERQRRRFLCALNDSPISWDEDDRPILHAANSAGAIGFPHARFDMVRPGIASFGLSCGLRHDLYLRPVMSLRARITHEQSIARGASVSYGAAWRASRASRIATVSAGYADGYPRLVSGRAQVLVRGRRVPVVGRVTMDQILVDVSGVPARVGEVVTLWGRDGEEEISADEVAGWAQTIGYEITCGVAARVRRVAVNEERIAVEEAVR